MSEKERMLAGELYRADDSELLAADRASCASAVRPSASLAFWGDGLSRCGGISKYVLHVQYGSSA